MAANLQIYETTIAAETRVESLLDSVQDNLRALNARLLELHCNIKACQPVAPGSVCLELYPCGKGCSGCPHARWTLYAWSPSTATKPNCLIGINLNAKGRDPILALARKAPHFATASALIREAKSILVERAALIKWIKQAHSLNSNFRRHLDYTR